MYRFRLYNFRLFVEFLIETVNQFETLVYFILRKRFELSTSLLKVHNVTQIVLNCRNINFINYLTEK